MAAARRKRPRRFRFECRNLRIVVAGRQIEAARVDNFVALLLGERGEDLRECLTVIVVRPQCADDLVGRYLIPRREIGVGKIGRAEKEVVRPLEALLGIATAAEKVGLKRGVVGQTG